MAFSDPVFEARRTQMLGGGKAPTTSSFASPTVQNGFQDPNFEQRRVQILQQSSQPKPVSKPVSTPVKTVTQPKANPVNDFFSTVGVGAGVVADKVKGLFTPNGGKPQPIKPLTPEKPLNLQLTPEQKKSIGTLKVGQKIPDFATPTAGSSATVKGGAAKNLPVGNVIDNIFIKPNAYVLDHTGIVGQTIKSKVADFYNHPAENIYPVFKNIEKNPVIAAKLKENPIYKFETNALQGTMQGALRVYGNISPTVKSFLDKELTKPVKGGDSAVAGNTVGNVIGTIGAFVLGGEVATGLKLGRAALPAVFATLGQTSLSSDTSTDARLRNLVIDTVSGTLLEYIKPLANLEHLSFVEQGAEHLKQLTKSMATMTAQVYLDARSVGADNKQALEMVKNSALIMLGLHGFMVAGKAGDFAMKSQFKEGSAEFTPDQARSAVVGSNLENTKLGEAIIKSSIEAEAQGKNLKIDMSAAKESKVAGVVKKFTGLETPNGVKVSNIELVDPTTAKSLPAEPAQGEPVNTATETPPVAPVEPKPAETAVTTSEPIKANPEASVTDAVPFKITPPENVKPAEKPFFDYLQKNGDNLVNQYQHNFGNLINTDIAKTLFNEAGYNDINTADAQRAAGKLTEVLYDKAIETQKGVGNNTVIGTMGGTGSGKSSTVGELLGSSKDQYPIINDSTGSSQNHLDRQIQQALDNGYKFRLIYVYRDPIEAWDNGVLNRNRHVPMETHISTHKKARDNFIASLIKFGNNPNFDAQAFVNSTDKKPRTLTLAEIQKLEYNRENIWKGIYESTETHHKAGSKEHLTTERYNAIQGQESSKGDKASSGKSVEEPSKNDLKDKTPLPSPTKETIPSQAQNTEKTATTPDRGEETAIEKMDHRPSDFTPGYDLTKDGLMPKDVYTNPEYYADMSQKSYQQSVAAIQKMHGKPNMEVTVYRAAPTDKLSSGDWITLSEEYAKEHAERQGGEVFSYKVKADEISFAGDDLNEFGYFPKSNTTEQPVGDTQELKLEPSSASDAEEVKIEAARLNLPEDVIKTDRHSNIIGYNRPAIGKSELKTIIANSPEFRANPVLTVKKVPTINGEKTELVFEGNKIHFNISAEAMQLSPTNLRDGDTIKVDEKTLTGKAQQMRVKNSKGESLGFNPINLENPFSKKSTEELTSIQKQSTIAKTLSEKLNVPIRQGKFRHGGAIGIYKPGQKIVRIKSGGLDTIFHEVGHFLDDTIGFSQDLSKEERTNLMQEYGHTYEGDSEKQRKEAFAEYLRFNMTGQTEKISQWAPEFDKVFKQKIETMPQVKEVIETAKADYKRWKDQPSVAKILSHISIGGQEKASLKDRAVQTMHDIYTSSLDDLHPLSEFSNLAKKKIGKVSAEKDPYILARNLRGWVGKADLFLNRGTFGKDYWRVDAKGKTKIVFKGKGYSEIMRPIEKAGNLDDFRVFIISQRIVNDLADRGIKTGISVDDAKLALEELTAKHPEFEKVAEERRLYKDHLLEFARDNGVIGDEGLKKIKELNKFHVPFYRVMEETQTRFLGKTKIGGNIGNPIKKIRGSEREIIDPLESDVKDTYAIINAAERNNIGVAMANIAKENHELGRIFEEVAKPMKPVTVNAKEVLDKIMKQTGTADGLEMPEELADLAVTLFRTTYATGPNMLNVNMGDTQKVFQVDPDIFNAIQGLNVEDVATVFKILAFPAKILRAGATLSPDFSVRNPLRDQFTAFVYSKYGFIPGVDLVRGMFELFKHDNTYDLWKAAGGEHAMFVSLDRTALQKNFKQLHEGKGAMILDVVKDPVGVLRLISELGEAGTRLGEMRNALSRGANPVEAAYASRNVTLDFARIGSKTKAVNAIIAFFNANIQGTDTMIRNFRNNPFSTLFKVLMGITLPSILLYLSNRKDPRWKEIPSWQKDLFWIVLTPDHIWRIPKPFELGVLFGSVPERVLEVMDTKDPDILNELENTIAQGFTPGFIPTALIPVIENITNYSMFMNRPIVSQGKESLPPPQQSGTYTTEVSKILGQALNYSPAKIDNLINGYSGGLGKYTVSVLDGILKGTGVSKVPPSPANALEDQPVIKAFMIRPAVGTGSESVNKVYNMYQTTNAQLTYAKQLIKQGQDKEALAYIKSHPDSIKAIVLSGAVNDFSTLNKAVDMIKQSDTMNPQEKAKKIQKIQILETNLAEKTLQQVKNLKTIK